MEIGCIPQSMLNRMSAYIKLGEQLRTGWGATGTEVGVACCRPTPLHMKMVERPRWCPQEPHSKAGEWLASW